MDYFLGVVDYFWVASRYIILYIPLGLLMLFVIKILINNINIIINLYITNYLS